ncbi:amidohydrolase family protein [Phormidium sp. CCY1219]|uniref:amidohydrolase family protein n=1 Tax=Phormidium sp. CCY1219 TaxID=2886104 RepID=UPI002D1EE656|nr:amidohydrolase family protein [Phormidium sp. CCY1219]MEB3831311.1 amidohydrolase family protein [Phormidium sp. CCY1219]
MLQLEMLAETLLREPADFATFLARFHAELDPPPPGVVGFKSIAAYRTDLAIESVSPKVAKPRFDALKNAAKTTSFRLQDKCFIDFLIAQGLEIAAQYELPVQFHTGFGDRDLDLRRVNPLHLRPLLEDSRFQTVPFVLLHAAYPFSREASYLASVYPQVYLDFGLAVPYLSVAGMRHAVQMLLELAPTSKIMYSSDAHFIPKLYYLAAKWGRKILADCLEAAIGDLDLTPPEAEDIATAILQRNARHLYRL